MLQEDQNPEILDNETQSRFKKWVPVILDKFASGRRVIDQFLDLEKAYPKREDLIQYLETCAGNFSNGELSGPERSFIAQFLVYAYTELAEKVDLSRENYILWGLVVMVSMERYIIDSSKLSSTTETNDKLAQIKTTVPTPRIIDYIGVAGRIYPEVGKEELPSHIAALFSIILQCLK